MFLCVPAGNTLCKSGSIAVFGNVVYSGLLNDHLWHLGVPLFTRLVRAAGPSVHTYLHFVRRVSCGSVEPKQASGAEFPQVCNGLLLMPALLTCVGLSHTRRAGCDSHLLWISPSYLSILFHLRLFKSFSVLSEGSSFR